MAGSDERREEVLAFVRRAGRTYHRLDFGDGIVLDGEYDMDAYLKQYHLPDDLEGKTALDAGTSSGYFAFEMARRGAEVTAIDLFDDSFFNEARDALGLSARTRYVQKNVYDLNAGFGQFDLVFCGSLLLHLPDPLGALRALRAVCRGQAIVATEITENRQIADLSVCEFLGTPAADGDYFTYWRMTLPGLRAMLLCAGFARAEPKGTFVLRGRSGYASLHGVVHAWV